MHRCLGCGHGKLEIHRDCCAGMGKAGEGFDPLGQSLGRCSGIGCRRILLINLFCVITIIWYALSFYAEKTKKLATLRYHCGSQPFTVVGRNACPIASIYQIFNSYSTIFYNRIPYNVNRQFFDCLLSDTFVVFGFK